MRWVLQGVLALGLGSSAVADNDQSAPELCWQSPLRCSVGQDVLHKSKRVFMHAEGPGCCLAPAQRLQISQCSLRGLGFFWFRMKWSCFPSSLRSVEAHLHRFGVLKRLQWCHLTAHPNCVYYNFTTLGAALQGGCLWLYSDFTFSSTHKVPKAFLFKLGLKFWIATQSLWRHA